MKALITGAGGLIGSEAATFFLRKKWQVIGIDNNQRKYFFGENGDTSQNIAQLYADEKFTHVNIDIRQRKEMANIFKKYGPFDLIVHTAAQPSHDWAKKEPFTDFDINAVGTLNMLEAYRLYSPKAVFIFTSTNKVYGDRPNEAKLVEGKKRYSIAGKQKLTGVSSRGVNEAMSIDHSTHSLFGASKVAADILCQEYGRYFHLNVGVFRGGCLTGPQHSAVPLHGFLAYIVDCAIHEKPYIIMGYKGKQVRDQIHSKDVVAVFWEFYKNPKQGEVYNLGGGRENSASILEIIDILNNDFNLRLEYTYDKINRVGDHICYYTDLSKLKHDFPNWKIQWSLKRIIQEIIQRKKERNV